MFLYPAIDLYESKAVRLYKGDYNQMTVYSNQPAEVAKSFELCGAKRLHLVDLEGARDGVTSNLPVIEAILNRTNMFTQVGGGIRSMETAQRYLSLGVDRVILGTAAVNDEGFLKQALDRYGEKIAVGVDLKDGCVAIRGWTEKSNISADEFFEKMQALGVATIICTDISKDGAMLGTNRELYRELSQKFSIDLIASGGVSSLEDIAALKVMGLHGAIVGKAYYTGAIELTQALEVAR